MSELSIYEHAVLALVVSLMRDGDKVTTADAAEGLISFRLRAPKKNERSNLRTALERIFALGLIPQPTDVRGPAADQPRTSRGPAVLDSAPPKTVCAGTPPSPPKNPLVVNSLVNSTLSLPSVGKETTARAHEASHSACTSDGTSDAPKRLSAGDVLDVINDVRCARGMDFQVGVKPDVLDALRVIGAMAAKERPEDPHGWVRDAHDAYLADDSDGFLPGARWPLTLWCRTPGKWLLAAPSKRSQEDLDAEFERCLADRWKGDEAHHARLTARAEQLAKQGAKTRSARERAAQAWKR